MGKGEDDRINEEWAELNRKSPSPPAPEPVAERVATVLAIITVIVMFLVAMAGLGGLIWGLVQLIMLVSRALS